MIDMPIQNQVDVPLPLMILLDVSVMWNAQDWTTLEWVRNSKVVIKTKICIFDSLTLFQDTTYCEEMYNLDNDSFLNSLETVAMPTMLWSVSPNSDSDV